MGIHLSYKLPLYYVYPSVAWMNFLPPEITMQLPDWLVVYLLHRSVLLYTYAGRQLIHAESRLALS